jgi:hypothetical protein
MLGALALLCEHRGPSAAATPPPATPSTATTPLQGASKPLWLLNTAFGTAALLLAALVWNTRPSVNAAAPVPNLPALLPNSPSGWEVRTTNLYAFRGTLQTEYLAQRDYFRREANRPPTEVVIYAAYWRAGQASVSLVASHTPDACWPGAGWNLLPNPQTQTSLRTSERTLPAAEYRVFTTGGSSQHVWFWHLHDGQPLAFRDPYSAVELLRLSWKYGLRRSGDQLFVRISSNRPWNEIHDAAPLREFFSRTKSLGL